MIHVRIDAGGTGDGGEQWRPAIVTQVFGPHGVNASVFLDAGNDARHIAEGHLKLAGNLLVVNDAIAGVASAVQGEGPGNWRWPLRS